MGINGGRSKNTVETSDQSVQDELFFIFSKVIEQTTELVIILDKKLEFLYCNSRFEKFCGYTKAEINGRPFRQFIAPTQNKAVLDFATMQIQNGKVFSVEYAISRKDKSVVYADVLTTPVAHEGSNEIIYFVCTGHDVTERKKVNELLHKKETQLRVLYETISDIVIILDLDGQIEYMTPCHTKCNGGHINTDGSTSLYSFIPMADRQPLKTLFSRLASGITEETKTTLKFNCPNEGVQELEAVARFIKSESDSRIVLVCKNMSQNKADREKLETYRQTLQNELAKQQKEMDAASERMQQEMAWRLEAEEELRIKEERLDLAIEVSDHGLWDLNFETGSIYYNEHFSTILGFPNEFQGKLDLNTFESLIPPEDVRNFQKAFSDHANNLTPKLDIEHRIITSARKEKWLSVKGKVVARDQNDNPIRFIGRVEDITQRKVIEKQIQSALEKEKELHDLKSSFISKASHEFRTPLATILSSTEILENYLPQLNEEERGKQFVTIHKCIDALIEMLTDVITLNKPELKNPDLGAIVFDVVAFVGDLIEETRKSFPKTPRISYLPKQPSQKIYMSEKLLRQITGNLLTNAIKYTPEDKSITVQLQAGKNVVLTVADEGIGIPAEDQKKLFEPFYRGNNVDGIPGSGLGLSILKQSVDSLNGKVELSSEPGMGTTFTVTLPLPGKK